MSKLPFFLFQQHIVCTVYRKLPQNITPDRLHNYTHELRKQLKLTKPATFLSGLYFRGINFRNLIFPDLSNSFPFGLSFRYLLTSSLYFIAALIRGRFTQVTQPVLIVTDHWSDGYFHWITEALPRAIFLSRLTQCNHVLISDDIFDYPFVRESLSHVGLQPYSAPSNHIVSVRTYHTGLKCLSTGNYWPYHLTSLRYLLQISTTIPDHSRATSKYSPIWISRKKASRRHIINEHETLPFLRAYGFKVVYLEDLSFSQQIELVRQASILAGPHGAGLSLMIAMSPGTTIVEVRSENDSINNCYFNMAASLGMSYYYAEAKPAYLDGQYHLAIDSDRFKLIIDSIINQP